MAGKLMAWDLPIPRPLGKNVAVRLTSGALRQVRRGHPWVFDRAITDASHDGEPGDLAVVFDRDRKFAAIGLWDPSSPIRIKILHTGRPHPIDHAFFTSRIDDALRRRTPLLADARTDAFRVVHGENDGLPGLVVDAYGDVLVVKIYSEAWWPHLPVVGDALHATLTPRAVILRFARALDPERLGRPDGAVIAGALDDPVVTFNENGLRFRADVVHGQKTGHFLDQRENRQRVRAQAAGARVLDVFCHTGAFGVHAAAGGATEVLAIDRSLPALHAAHDHMVLNGVDRHCAFRTIAGDGFDELDQLARRGERFDLVVIDPPSFAARQSDRPAAIRAYTTLARLGAAVVASGGLLVQASCSSRIERDDHVDAVRAGVAAAGASMEIQEITGHALDHPIGFPHGAYLKAVFARINPGAR